MTTQKRVTVGMSGGVDSSVAVALLKEKGHDVTGVFIEAYNEPGCRTDEDKKDALRVATKLGVKFQVLDLRKEYKEKVVKYFFDEYRAGRTPNPDVVCNREVKFGLFYDWAMAEKFDWVATGHYARIMKVLQYSSIPVLQRAKDLGKDQSYFLWQVKPEHLGHMMFPLGEMTKKEVREKARELGLANADKPDSMGICMMGELNVRDFLRNKLGERPGEVVWGGKVVGKHRGLWFHTIGERGGWELNPGTQTTAMPPFFVIAKEKGRNRLIVGTREQAMTDKITIQSLELRIDENKLQEMVEQKKLFVRIRNLGELTPVTRLHGDTVTLEEQVFGIAEGQSAVFYARLDMDGDEIVAGGGIISV